MNDAVKELQAVYLDTEAEYAEALTHGELINVDRECVWQFLNLWPDVYHYITGLQK